MLGGDLTYTWVDPVPVVFLDVIILFRISYILDRFYVAYHDRSYC